MNIIHALIARIEEHRATNKQPCKNYATEAAAEKATQEAAKVALANLGTLTDKRPVRYVVFFVPAWGRWVGALDFTELLSRRGTGGYIGCCPGFYTF
jgi:hypothetical protein